MTPLYFRRYAQPRPSTQRIGRPPERSKSSGSALLARASHPGRPAWGSCPDSGCGRWSDRWRSSRRRRWSSRRTASCTKRLRFRSRRSISATSSGGSVTVIRAAGIRMKILLISPVGAGTGIRVGSSVPVARPSLVVGECQDVDGVGSFEVDQMVGEPSDRRSPHRQVWWHFWDRCSSSREAANLLQRGVHRSKESSPQPGPTIFVPSGGLFELFRGFVLRPKRLRHRFVRFASARRRKSFQGVPLDSPLMTLRARRSISAAQAASTSALSSGPASRLSRSSTATLARSSGANFRASSSISLTSAMCSTLAPSLPTPDPRVQGGRRPG